jgi:hypothetical protein
MTAAVKRSQEKGEPKRTQEKGERSFIVLS